MSLNSSGGTINIGDDDIDQAINIGTQGERTISIGTGAFADTVAIGNATGASAVTITSGTGNIALASTGTGDITINSDDTLLLDADGVLELNSSAGAINIGNDADAQAINVGTGGAARAITIGNKTGATAVTLDTGTGGIITSRTVATIGDSATDATAAQYLNGYIHCTGGGADTWTLPTGAALADVMPSASVTVGDSFRCYVFNESGGTITYAAGASGSTINVGNANGDFNQKTASLAILEFIFTVATDGSEEYVCILLADSS